MIARACSAWQDTRDDLQQRQPHPHPRPYLTSPHRCPFPPAIASSSASPTLPFTDPAPANPALFLCTFHWRRRCCLSLSPLSVLARTCDFRRPWQLRTLANDQPLPRPLQTSGSARPREQHPCLYPGLLAAYGPSSICLKTPCGHCPSSASVNTSSPSRNTLASPTHYNPHCPHPALPPTRQPLPTCLPSSVCPLKSESSSTPSSSQPHATQFEDRTHGNYRPTSCSPNP